MHYIYYKMYTIGVDWVLQMCPHKYALTIAFSVSSYPHNRKSALYFLRIDLQHLILSMVGIFG